MSGDFMDMSRMKIIQLGCLESNTNVKRSSSSCKLSSVHQTFVSILTITNYLTEYIILIIIHLVHDFTHFHISLILLISYTC